MDLTDPQIERYSRQILLREVGGEGQEKILAARVLVAGEGPVLPVAALYLAAAGVGTIGLACATGDERLAGEIHAVNPEIRVSRQSRESLSEEVIAGYDLVITASLDNHLRDRLNRSAAARRATVITGACGGDHGFVAVLHPLGGGGCLACAKWPPLDHAVTPLTPALVGAVGTLLATEALKTITGIGDLLTGRLLRLDARASNYAAQVLERRPSCPVCRAT